MDSIFPITAIAYCPWMPLMLITDISTAILIREGAMYCPHLATSLFATMLMAPYELYFYSSKSPDSQDLRKGDKSPVSPGGGDVAGPSPKRDGFARSQFRCEACGHTRRAKGAAGVSIYRSKRHSRQIVEIDEVVITLTTDTSIMKAEVVMGKSSVLTLLRDDSKIHQD